MDELDEITRRHFERKTMPSPRLVKKNRDTKLPTYNDPHVCEVPDCEEVIPPYRHVCDTHWKQIPFALRKRVSFNQQIYLKALILALDAVGVPFPEESEEVA